MDSMWALSLPKSPFLRGARLLRAPPPVSQLRSGRRGGGKFRVRASLGHIPKQFRQENLKEGLAENFKNVLQYLYGLTPSQMDMFMTEDNPARRQLEKVTEDEDAFFRDSAVSHKKLSKLGFTPKFFRQQGSSEWCRIGTRGH